MVHPVVRTLRRDVSFAWRQFALNLIAGSTLVPRSARSRLYRLLGLSVGASNFYPHIRFLLSGHGRFVVGDGCMLNEGVVVDRSADITIGDGVAVGPDVMFCTSSHLIGGSRQRAGEVTARPIVIGAGSWIGARAVVLPGAEIGPGSVVAAGAVVTGRCTGNALYGGVPARLIRELVADDRSATRGAS